MKKYLFAALAVSMLYSCNTSSEKKDDGHAGHAHQASDNPLSAQTQEMLDIHDSIMPHMDKLMDLKKQLGDNIKVTDSLLAIKSSSLLKSRKEEAEKLHAQLDNADKAMMDWMHEFKFDTLKSLDQSQAELYVADQKKKIERVRVLMEDGLNDAGKFIEKTKE